MPDKAPPNFALLIGKPKKKPDDQVDHEADLGAEDMDSKGAKSSAVKDLLTSISLKDSAGVQAALEDFIKACEYDEDEPEEEESAPDDAGE